MNLPSIAITTFLAVAANARGEGGAQATQPDRNEHHRLLRKNGVPFQLDAADSLPGVAQESVEKVALYAGPDKYKNQVCGVDGAPDCYQRLPRRAQQGFNGNLKSCLIQFIQGEVTLYSNSDGDFTVNKLSFPGDDGYTDASLGPGETQGGPRYPAAIVYAETEDDITNALGCATSFGYQVSPRGRGHHFQGMSRMDGQVVIDLSLLCDPTTFEILPPKKPDWILPGQKWINSIKSGAGCTNAVMLAYNDRENPDAKAEGGIYSIGSCPSVGITGFVTGGGAGDTTPYTGYAADDTVEVDMILANGTKVTANKYNEHRDLFWAVQGGGSGFGIITNLTRAVIASPEPEAGKARKFSFIELFYFTSDETSNKKFLENYQHFLYHNPKSSRFGGAGGIASTGGGLIGLFLGSVEEFISIFSEANLLNDANPPPTGVPPEYGASVVTKNYNTVDPLPEGMPPFGVKVFEFDSYAEALLFRTCFTYSTDSAGAFPLPGIGYTAFSEQDWCADLGIDASKCVPREVLPLQPFFPTRTINFLPGNADGSSCLDPDVIEKFGDAAYNVKGFFHRAGTYSLGKYLQSDTEDATAAACAACNPDDPQSAEACGLCTVGQVILDNYQVEFQSSAGGLMIPELDVDVLDEIAQVGLTIGHFQHGAAMVPGPSDTALGAQRDTAIMTSDATPADVLTEITNILVNDHYNGDPSALQGYVNYPGPIGNRYWKKFYYGENYEKLSKIKAKYDPLSIFGNPIQVQAADTEGVGN